MKKIDKAFDNIRLVFKTFDSLPNDVRNNTIGSLIGNYAILPDDILNWLFVTMIKILIRNDHRPIVGNIGEATYNIFCETALMEKIANHYTSEDFESTHEFLEKMPFYPHPNLALIHKKFYDDFVTLVLALDLQNQQIDLDGMILSDILILSKSKFFEIHTILSMLIKFPMVIEALAKENPKVRRYANFM